MQLGALILFYSIFDAIIAILYNGKNNYWLQYINNSLFDGYNQNIETYMLYNLIVVAIFCCFGGQ